MVDKQTGQQRLPNQEEVDEVVASLSVLTNRPENLSQTPTASGAITVDLEGGFGGVMLGRPNVDGTWETKCVFTFAEGAEFLGLVEDNSTIGGEHNEKETIVRKLFVRFVGSVSAFRRETHLPPKKIRIVT